MYLFKLFSLGVLSKGLSIFTKSLPEKSSEEVEDEKLPGAGVSNIAKSVMVTRGDEPRTSDMHLKTETKQKSQSITSDLFRTFDVLQPDPVSSNTQQISKSHKNPSDLGTDDLKTSSNIDSITTDETTLDVRTDIAEMFDIDTTSVSVVNETVRESFTDFSKPFADNTAEQINEGNTGSDFSLAFDMLHPNSVSGSTQQLSIPTKNPSNFDTGDQKTLDKIEPTATEKTSHLAGVDLAEMFDIDPETCTDFPKPFTDNTVEQKSGAITSNLPQTFNMLHPNSLSDNGQVSMSNINHLDLGQVDLKSLGNAESIAGDKPTQFVLMDIAEMFDIDPETLTDIPKQLTDNRLPQAKMSEAADELQQNSLHSLSEDHSPHVFDMFQSTPSGQTYIKDSSHAPDILQSSPLDQTSDKESSHVADISQSAESDQTSFKQCSVDPDISQSNPLLTASNKDGSLVAIRFQFSPFDPTSDQLSSDVSDVFQSTLHEQSSQLPVYKTSPLVPCESGDDPKSGSQHQLESCDMFDMPDGIFKTPADLLKPQLSEKNEGTQSAVLCDNFILVR